MSSPTKFNELIETVSGNFADGISQLLDDVNEEVNEHTTYASGLKDIEDAMERIGMNIMTRKVSLKFVVFVDDTDRCSPEKAGTSS